MSDGKLRNVLKLIIYNLKAFFQSGNYVINTSEIAKDIKEILIQASCGQLEMKNDTKIADH